MNKNSKSRILCILTLLIITFSISCSNEKALDFNTLYIERSMIKNGFESAKQNNKKVLVVFDAVWCGACKQFNQNTLANAHVKQELSDYEVIKIDIDKYEYETTVFRGNGSRAIPAVMIFSPEGIHKDGFIGSFGPAQFIDVLRKNR